MAASVYAEDAMRAAAIANAGVLAAVGSRIYPVGSVPQVVAELPFIVYQRTSAPREHHLSGVSGMSIGRVAWTIYGATYDATKALADNCRLALDGLRGTKTVGGNSIVIKCCLLDDESEQVIDPDDGTEERTYVWEQSYIVAWIEATS